MRFLLTIVKNEKHVKSIDSDQYVTTIIDTKR